MKFKDGFVWGAASAAYQIEGAAYEDGKGLNIWDIFCRDEGKTIGNHSGDVACDHYHRWREDVGIMKAMGLRAYRFSINWARILPDGIGRINPKGIEFYNNLIDALLEAGIEPYITLYHWDLPYELYKRGGWLNPDMPEWFGEYAAVVAKSFSDRVKYFITQNEPQCFIGLGYARAIQAPGLKNPNTDIFLMAHNAMKAHGMAVIKLREHAKQPINVGYAPTGSMHYPETNSAADIEAARKAVFACPDDTEMWNVSWWSDPVMLGEYPADGLKLYEKYLPRITPEDMKLISQPLDFYGQNIYNGAMVRAGKDGEPEFVSRYEGFPRTAISYWPVTPESLYWGPKFLYERYGKPIYITENGMSCHDVISVDGKVHDPNRIDFLTKYLRELARAGNDGIDIHGYFQWSVMDVFEWNSGYAERLGLVYVDYPTGERTIKDSGHWYRTVIETNEV